jgi:HEAT repeat protein
MDGALRRIGELTVQDLEVRRGQYGPTGGACSCEALKDEDVRRAAAWALGEIKDPSTVPQLLGALKDKNSGVRYWAADALGEIGDKSAITPLRAQLGFLGIFGGEKDYYVRDKIKDAIRRLEGK